MDIHNVIKKDHDEARELLEKITNARSDNRRKELMLQLKEAILLHAKTEEATYYQALSQFPELENKMTHAEDEHDTVEQLFDKISRSKADSDNWLLLMGEIKMALEHHMEEEEGDIFKKSKELLTPEQCEALGKEMQTLKEEALADA